MSWSEVFPVLTDEHVDAFEAKVTAKERKQFAEWFTVKEIINPREVTHIVSTSLFWKNIRASQPQIVIKNRAMVMNAKHSGKLLRFDPWEHYVDPLLRGAHWLHKRRKDAAFRVYLAADLEFLVPDLVAVGCEVRLMKSSSIAHNPGAMWRMLALEEEGKLVTIVDADRAARPEADMARTDEARRLRLGWWRVPVWGELNEIGNVGYRPMLGCQIGANQSLPIRQIMHALIWHTQHQTIRTDCYVPCCKPAACMEAHGQTMATMSGSCRQRSIPGRSWTVFFPSSLRRHYHAFCRWTLSSQIPPIRTVKSCILAVLVAGAAGRERQVLQ